MIIYAVCCNADHPGVDADQEENEDDECERPHDCNAEGSIAAEF